jgi:hypothetical protein
MKSVGGDQQFQLWPLQPLAESSDSFTLDAAIQGSRTGCDASQEPWNKPMAERSKGFAQYNNKQIRAYPIEAYRKNSRTKRINNDVWINRLEYKTTKPSNNQLKTIHTQSGRSKPGCHMTSRS